MSRSLNRATLIGHLGSDPELRTTPNGNQVCTLRIATADRFKDKNGEWTESTDWHNVVLWDRLAEIASQYLRKGKKVFIEGRIKYRQYETKEGQTRHVTDIIANSMILLETREGGGSSGYGQTGDFQDKDFPSSGMDSHLAPDDDVPF